MRTTIGAMQNSIKTATDIATLLRQSNVSFQRMEMETKLADLERALMEAKSELAEIQDVLAEKDMLISELTTESESRNRIVVHLLNGWPAA